MMQEDRPPRREDEALEDGGRLDETRASRGSIQRFRADAGIPTPGAWASTRIDAPARMSILWIGVVGFVGAGFVWSFAGWVAALVTMAFEPPRCFRRLRLVGQPASARLAR
jgi:hypothetical protein